MDALDAGQGAGMIAIMIGALVATGILLWSGGGADRLRLLLSARSTTGDDPSDGRPGTPAAGDRFAEATGGRSRRRGRSAGDGGPVSDEHLAFDLDLVAICLTSGLPVVVALTLAAEATEDRSGLRRLSRALTIGDEAPEADPRLRPVVDAVEFSDHTGVGPAPLIESVARELRDSSRRSRQEAAAALGVRLVVPLGLCILPSFLLLSVVPLIISLLADITAVLF